MNMSVINLLLTTVLRVGTIGLPVRSRKKLAPSIKMRMRSSIIPNPSLTSTPPTATCNGRTLSG
jgi:hypothetical protein